MVQLLTPQQKAFAEYHAKDGLAVGPAGVKAGYSRSYAYTQLSIRMKENIELCKYIKELEEEAKKDRLLTRDDKREWLKHIIESPTEKTSDKLKAMDILNRMETEYLERREISGGFTLVVNDDI